MSSPKKQSAQKIDSSCWEERRGIIRSRKGGWVIGEAIYNHGYSMMDDLVGKASFFQVLVLNVTGNLPERRLADWLEALFICLSWPDARIWCNQMGSLGGTLRTSPVAAVAAGMLASDSHMYGPGTLLAATRFIEDALAASKQGASVAEIIRPFQRRAGTSPIIVGYGRPVATGDERVVAMAGVADALGFAIGEHLALARQIEQEIARDFGETMNLAGYLTAFLCDQGFSAVEIYRMSAIMVVSGVHACYVESFDALPEGFFPLRCDDVKYCGRASRPVPSKGNQE